MHTSQNHWAEWTAYTDYGGLGRSGGLVPVGADIIIKKSERHDNIIV